MINIFTAFNGVGLQQDGEILRNIFAENNIPNRLINIKEPFRQHNADINIFLEIIVPRYFHCAKINILIPNPEWFQTSWCEYVPFFNSVFCKTKDCLNIFSKYTNKAVFTSFTSRDYYLPDIKKKRVYLHTAGKSETKGTKRIIECYSQHGDLPELFITAHDRLHQYVLGTFDMPKGIKYIPGRLDNDIFTKFRNTCGFHLCPSEYEGFGHYINEARSMGNYIFTTDAEPMNEFVNKNTGCLVKYNSTKMQQMGELKLIDSKDLYLKIKESEDLTDKYLLDCEKESRELFLQNDLFFKRKLVSLIRGF